MEENTQLVPYSVTDKWLELTGGEEMTKEASQLPEDKLTLLANQFIPFLEQVVQLEQVFKGIEVTEEDDAAGMKKAREARLAFRKARTECENIRKEEKQWANIVGRTIDYMGRTVKSRCEYWENHYKEHETFAERMEAERKEALRLEREELLSPYVDELDGWDLAGMNEDAFNKLLSASKIAHEAEQAAAEKRAQEERERLESERLERQRLREENERLQDELRAKQEAELAQQKQAEEAKRIAESTDDLDKLRKLYQDIQAIDVPAMQGVAGGIGRGVQQRLNDCLVWIAKESAALKNEEVSA